MIKTVQQIMLATVIFASSHAFAASYECRATDPDYEEFTIKFEEAQDGQVGKIEFFDNDQWHTLACRIYNAESEGYDVQHICTAESDVTFKSASIMVDQFADKKVRLAEVWLAGSRVTETSYDCKNL